MPIEPVSGHKHSFYRMTVEGHPDLERVMTNSNMGTSILSKAVAWARDTYESRPVVLQSPEDAWIARLAQCRANPEHASAFKDQMTRGIVLVWYERRKYLTTVYTGVPHNPALARAQDANKVWSTGGDWELPLGSCREILAIQKCHIRPYPGDRVELDTKYGAAHDRLTQDMFGEATPLIAKYLSDNHNLMLYEYFPTIDHIQPGHARIGVVCLGGKGNLCDVDADMRANYYGRARGVVADSRTSRGA